MNEWQEDFDRDPFKGLPRINHDDVTRTTMRQELGFKHIPREVDTEALLSRYRDEAEDAPSASLDARQRRLWLWRVQRAVLILAAVLGLLAWLQHLDARTAENVEAQVREGGTVPVGLR